MSSKSVVFEEKAPEQPKQFAGVGWDKLPVYYWGGTVASQITNSYLEHQKALISLSVFPKTGAGFIVALWVML